MGVGEGLPGQYYALPNMDKFFKMIPLNELKDKIENFFVKVCKDHPEKIFLPTKIGCEIARYIPEEIAPLFKDSMPLPINLILPREFHEVLYK